MNPQSASMPQTRKIPRWLKIILIIILVLAVFFVGVFVLANQATKNAVKVSDQLVADMQTNNTSAAYGLTASSFKAATTQDQLTQLVNQISPLLQGKAKVTGKAINKATGQPNQAIVVYSISTSSGTKYLRVVLQDNKGWQVLNFRSSETPLDTSSTN